MISSSTLTFSFPAKVFIHLGWCFWKKLISSQITKVSVLLFQIWMIPSSKWRRVWFIFLLPFILLLRLFFIPLLFPILVKVHQLWINSKNFTTDKTPNHFLISQVLVEFYDHFIFLLWLWIRPTIMLFLVFFRV